MARIRFTILGECASKANSRRLVPTASGKVRSIKSGKGLDFERTALLQIPTEAKQMIDAPCAIRLRIFYRTERPDLDESLLLDCLQARYKRAKNGMRVLLQRGVVTNDRLFRVKHVYHAIDRDNPRVEVTVWRIDGQGDLFARASEATT